MKPLLIALLLLPLSCFAQDDSSLVLYFDFDKAQLTRPARQSLDSFLGVKPGFFDTYKFLVNGHCDQSGSDSYNNVLSTKRVNTVVRYMRKYRVPASAISFKAYGEQMPVNNGETEDERQWSRRVEIRIVKQDENISLKEKIADLNRPNGSNIVLKNINFYGGRPVMLPSSEPMLKELLDAMNSLPKLVIEIQGHVCCEPTSADGMNNDSGVRDLSIARAEAIRDYLVEKGIAAERVSARGFGHTQPIYPYPEQSEEERVLNRRVEIKIINK
jgi:outer membrane protein OmpA-like peptidoglycan-associated protein